MNLYELTGAYLQIQNMIEEGAEGLEDTLEALNDALEDKAEGYGRVIRNLEAQAKALREEEKRLADRRKSIENSIARLKDNLQQSMLATGKRKIQTNLFTYSIQKNPPSVVVTDLKSIPEKYLVPQDPKVDKKAILTDWKSGEAIPGTEIRQTEGLRMR